MSWVDVHLWPIYPPGLNNSRGNALSVQSHKQRSALFYRAQAFAARDWAAVVYGRLRQYLVDTHSCSRVRDPHFQQRALHSQAATSH